MDALVPVCVCVCVCVCACIPPSNLLDISTCTSKTHTRDDTVRTLHNKSRFFTIVHAAANR